MHANGKIFPDESFNIPAHVWNDFCDAAADFKNRQNGQHAAATGTGESNVVYVRNDTAADIAPHQGLMLTELAAFPRQGAKTATRDKFVFSAELPDEDGTGLPAVALDRIAKNGCGRVAIAGIALAKITGTGNRVKFGDGSFEAAENGFAKIIWADTGAGNRLAMIHFQPAGSSQTTTEQRPIWIMSITSGTPANGYDATIVNDLGYTDHSALGMTFFPILTYSTGALPAGSIVLAVASKTPATAGQSTPPEETEE